MLLRKITGFFSKWEFTLFFSKFSYYMISTLISIRWMRYFFFEFLSWHGIRDTKFKGLINKTITLMLGHLRVCPTQAIFSAVVSPSLSSSFSIFRHAFVFPHCFIALSFSSMFPVCSVILHLLAYFVIHSLSSILYRAFIFQQMFFAFRSLWLLQSILHSHTSTIVSMPKVVRKDYR